MAYGSLALQRALDKQSVWKTDWDMDFNPSKCQTVQVPGYMKPINATHKLHGEVLETVSCAEHLGVDV